ncbi:MAG: hypothetical protein WDN31_13075 [Hyphomicrobium sp.]
MRKLLACCAAAMMAAALTPASAETSAPDDRVLKAPEKRMGDEGKLPPTEQLGNKVHDMTGPRTAATPCNEHTGPSGPKGPPKRMGDEGTLPATEKMGSKVPQMDSDQD